MKIWVPASKDELPGPSVMANTSVSAGKSASVADTVNVKVAPSATPLFPMESKTGAPLMLTVVEAAAMTPAEELS